MPCSLDVRDNISGYDVHLSLWEEDGQQRSGCWIGYRNWEWSSSLDLLDAMGVLEHNPGHKEPHAPPMAVIDEIMDWALENGY